MSRLWRSSGDSFVMALGASLCALGLWGCRAWAPVDVDSDAVLTRGLYGNFSAGSSGDGTVNVTAMLFVGGSHGTQAELRGSDQLWATVDGVMQRLGGGDGYYSTRFQSAGDGAKVIVDLRRGPDMQGAPESTLILPRAFSMSLEGLEPGDDLKRGRALTVEWSPASPGGSIAYALRGDCIYAHASRTSDDGSHVITAEEIKPLIVGKSCDVVVELTRTSTGNVDPNFEEGGRFTGSQIRALNFTSTPTQAELEEVDLDPPGMGGAMNRGGARN